MENQYHYGMSKTENSLARHFEKDVGDKKDDERYRILTRT